MKRRLILPLTIIIMIFPRAVSAEAHPNEMLAADNRDTLKISVYVTAHYVDRLLGTEEGLAQAVETLKPLGATKVFLDVYRGGFMPERDILEHARDYLREKGFEVAGGITTTKGNGFVPSPSSRYFICYDNEESRSAMKQISEYAASMFDEVIIDDFLATDCMCDECEIRKGDRDWGEYFRDVMVGISRDQIVGAIHAANPAASATIKYPQWYDNFHKYGYDVVRQPEIFDRVWCGTETRDPLVENVQQYQGFVNYTWMKSLAGNKLQGAWFDQINTYPEVYMEQAYQSVLAGAPELTLFGYSTTDFPSANTERFKENLWYLFEVAKSLKGLRRTGVYAYKPPNSDGGDENFLFDYLGMLGIPVAPTAFYPEKAKSIIVSEYGASDPDISKKIAASVQAGATVLISAGLIERMNSDESLIRLAGLEPPGAKKLKAKYANLALFPDHDAVPIAGYLEVGERLRIGDAQVITTAKVENMLYPVLTLKEHPGGGRVAVFNARTFEYFPESRDLVIPQPVFFINTPQEMARPMRDIATAPLGLHMKAKGTRISMYLFEYEFIALENFNNYPVDIELTFDPEKLGGKVKRLIDVYDGGKNRRDPHEEKDVFDFTLPARSMHLFKIVFDEGNPARGIDTF